MFAWSPKDLPGIDRTIAEHRLDVDPQAKPIRQKMRQWTDQKAEVLCAEVQKLLVAEVIREIDRTTWLANPVLVQMPNGHWRICIDYTSLNKHCPKDDFPMERIDQLVDATPGCKFMSFLDGYSGFHQVCLVEPDQPRTAFQIRGVFTVTTESLSD